MYRYLQQLLSPCSDYGHESCLRAPQITDIFHVSALTALLKDVILAASARAFDYCY